MAGRRLRVCRGDNKAKEDVSDMYYHLQSVQLDEVPIFLAMDIGMLPPLSGNTNDMSTIMRNMEMMQTQIASLTEAQKVMSEIMTSHICAEKNLSTTDKERGFEGSRTQLTTNDQTPLSQPLSQEDTHDQSSTLESSLSQHSSSSSDEMDEDNAIDNTILEPMIHNMQSSSKPSSSNHIVKSRIFQATKNTLSRPRNTHYQSSTNSGNGMDNNFKNVLSKRSSQLDTREKPIRSNNVQSKDPVHDTIVTGTGSAPGLQAVTRHRQQETDSSNRSCSGVFITRLKPHTTGNNVENYIRHETGLRVSPEKLPTRYDSYSSFFIRCSGTARASLLDGRMWPTGTLVKPYFS